ncbi:MAG: putative Universal stress protein UspA [Armatimonadetes bacterium]|jgi:nucleotide-binding universal stress UspA family protein|nr:putative Universal stress protein UspA [Armatimonadota bacterium]
MTQTGENTPVAERIWDGLEAEAAGGAPARPLKILFATDGSEEAAKAEKLLRALPLAPGTSIQVLTVTAAAEWTMPEWFVTGEHAWGRSVAEKAAEGLRRDGLTTAGTARSGAIAYELIQAADEFDVDLVVLGSKGLSGLAGFFLGSVARNVAKHARRSVVIARELRHELRHVVLAVDGSEHAEKAAQFAARLPLPEGAVVHVAQVVRTYQPYALVAPEFIVEYEEAVRTAQTQENEDAQSLTGLLCERLRKSGKQAEPAILRGDPAEEILKLAQHVEADLIIAGARGISLIEGLLVGSVADRILKQAQCSVLLVR